MSQPQLQSPSQSPNLPLINSQAALLTIIDFAVIMLSNGKWKVVNMDPQGPQKNIAWQIPGTNNWLARVSCHRAYAELLNTVGPAGGNTMRGFVNIWEDEVTMSTVVCKIRANEEGKVEYVPGGVKPERNEDFVTWLGAVMGFDALEMSV